MAKLLIVDDDKDTCEFLKDFFELRKCIVSTANSGIEGLEMVKEETPDIVLLDVKMPDMNGLEVLKQIKEYDKQIKVIIVTVASDANTRNKAAALGADDFVKKPLNTQYLENTVSIKVSNLTMERKK